MSTQAKQNAGERTWLQEMREVQAARDAQKARRKALRDGLILSLRMKLADAQIVGDKVAAMEIRLDLEALGYVAK